MQRPWKIDTHSPHQVNNMCSFLSEKLSQIEKNWESDKIVLVAVLLCSYTAYAMPDQHASFTVLQKCRRIASSWITSIVENTLTSVLQTGTLQDIDEIRTRLVSIGLIIVLSFDAPATEHTPILTAETAVDLLYALTTIYANTTSKGSGDFRRFATTSMVGDHLIELLFCKAQRVKLAYISELHELLAQPNSDICNKFIQKAFPGMASKWLPLSQDWRRYQYPRNDYYFAITSTNSVIQIGVMDGVFLINGAPMQKLPSEIEQASLFKRVFGTHVFEVLPYNEGYITSNVIFGAKWQFQMHKDAKVTIKEHQDCSGYQMMEDGDSDRILQLLPHDLFTNILQVDLVADYTHWYCAKEQIIEFRKLGFDSPAFVEPVYIAHLDPIPYLEHVQSGKSMLPMTSTLFRTIMSIFSRLDESNYVHMFW